MTKSFRKYLDRVDIALASLNGHRNDDDLRLYLFCRLMTVAEHVKAKADPQSTAAMLFRQYQVALADGRSGSCWWRYRGI